MILQFPIVLFLYPGLLLTLALAFLYAGLSGDVRQSQGFVRGLLSPGGWNSAEGLLNQASILLAGAGLACLPWPLHPVGSVGMGGLILAWGGLEGAFLLAVIPGLLAGHPPVVRAAIREAQISLMGRVPLWMAIATGVIFVDNWSMVTAQGFSPLAAHGLALVAAFFSLPIAIGWGPFAGEASITPGGLEQGLARPIAQAARSARTVRHAALLAATLVALLPLEPFGPWVGLLLLIATFVLASILLKKFERTLPRLSLPEILRMYWWRMFPLSMSVLIYLVIYW